MKNFVKNIMKVALNYGCKDAVKCNSAQKSKNLPLGRWGMLCASFMLLCMLSACAGNTANSSTGETSAGGADKTSVSEKETEKKKEDGTVKQDEKTENSEEKFVVGFDKDFPPMGFVGDSGEYEGFDLDLAKETAQKLGMEIVYQPIAWDAKELELENGNIDCIWNGFTMTGREDGYTWSMPYMENSQVFVVKKDSGIKDLAGLKGKNVEVQVDSSADAALKDKAEIAGTFGQLITVADYNTAFMDLEMGAADAVAMDIVVAGYQIEKRNSDDFVILDEKLSSEQYAIGFKKGNTQLRDKVDKTLKEMAQEGTLKKVSEKWFGRDVTIVK
nr:amino acid ABC transporter substrate-binding protein [Johnsonella ignava]